MARSVDFKHKFPAVYDRKKPPVVRSGAKQRAPHERIP